MVDQAYQAYQAYERSGLDAAHVPALARAVRALRPEEFSAYVGRTASAHAAQADATGLVEASTENSASSIAHDATVL